MATPSYYFIEKLTLELDRTRQLREVWYPILARRYDTREAAEEGWRYYRKQYPEDEFRIVPGRRAVQ